MVVDQKLICRQAATCCSLGQYGHLNLVLPLGRRFTVSLQSTWPQGSKYGGFVGVLCSLETGQTNIEWYLYFLPRSISTGSSSRCVQDSRVASSRVARIKTGSAIVPHATTLYRGLSSLRSRCAQKQRRKDCSASSDSAEVKNEAYGDLAIRDTKAKQPISC